MAEDRPSPPDAATTPPSPSVPPPGEPYGSGQAPPPAPHPYGTPRPDDAQVTGRPVWPPQQPPPPGPDGQLPGPPEPWAAPPGRPPPPVTPEQIALAGRLSRLALISAVAAPLVCLLSLPYTAVLGLGFGILAIVLGVRARHAADVARRSEASGVVAVVLGSVSTAFIAVVIAGYALLWDEIASYQDCMAGANTKLAESTCSDQLLDDARRRFGLD